MEAEELPAAPPGGIAEPPGGIAECAFIMAAGSMVALEPVPPGGAIGPPCPAMAEGFEAIFGAALAPGGFDATTFVVVVVTGVTDAAFWLEPQPVNPRAIVKPTVFRHTQRRNRAILFTLMIVLTNDKHTRKGSQISRTNKRRHGACQLCQFQHCNASSCWKLLSQLRRIRFTSKTTVKFWYRQYPL
jgi:hypothetical protein